MLVGRHSGSPLTVGFVSYLTTIRLIESALYTLVVLGATRYHGQSRRPTRRETSVSVFRDSHAVGMALSNAGDQAEAHDHENIRQQAEEGEE